MRQFTCPKAVTHPSTNRARCRATALIETNALLLHQTATLIVTVMLQWGKQAVACFSDSMMQGTADIHEQHETTSDFNFSFYNPKKTLARFRVF